MPAIEDSARYLPLSEVVYRNLRRSIIRGELAQGATLSETELARRLAVSKTPVREALSRLAQEGLLVTTPHKGAVVTNLSREDVEEIYRVRMQLEGLAARMAAERLTEEHAKSLTAILDDLEAATAARDATALRGRYVLLHQTIWDASRTRRLPALLLSLQDYVEMSRLSLFFEPSGLEVGLEEHGRVVRAIVARDPEGAEQAMVEHIGHTLELLRRAPVQAGARTGPAPSPAIQGG